MRFENRAYAIRWCKSNSVPIRQNTPNFQSDHRFDIPSDSDERIALCSKQLLRLGNSSRHLVWVTDWGIWPSIDQSDRFYELRKAFGETRPLIEAPCAIFGSNEGDELISYVSLAVESLWDIWVISTKHKRWIFYSHDEIGFSSGFA